MEATRSSETSVFTRPTHIPKGGILHIHRGEDLKSYTSFQTLVSLYQTIRRHISSPPSKLQILQVVPNVRSSLPDCTASHLVIAVKTSNPTSRSKRWYPLPDYTASYLVTVVKTSNPTRRSKRWCPLPDYTASHLVTAAKLQILQVVPNVRAPLPDYTASHLVTAVKTSNPTSRSKRSGPFTRLYGVISRHRRQNLKSYRSFQTLVPIYQTIRRHISKYGNLVRPTEVLEDLKSR
jgi:hypothetical protein